MWPCQQRIMIHQNSLFLHLDFKLVKDSLKDLLELLQILLFAGVRVMISSDKDYPTMKMTFDPPHGRKPATLIAEVAQMEYNTIFWNNGIPVGNQGSVMF